MENNNQLNSRRSFLSSLAILSAGAAFASPAKFIASPLSKTEIEQQWDIFCNHNNGKTLYGANRNDNQAAVNSCNGHTHKAGRVVKFSCENILAEPTWVYWGEEKNKPADVIITFFCNDMERKKLFRLNISELKALNILSAEENTISTLKEAQAMCSDKKKKKIQIEAIVKKDANTRLRISHSKKITTVETKFFNYN